MSETSIRVRNMQETVRRQMTQAPINVAIGAATTRSAQLEPGDYYLIASNDCYVRQGGAAVEATLTAPDQDHFIPYGVEFVVHVDAIGVNDRVAVIGTSGTLQLRRVEAI